MKELIDQGVPTLLVMEDLEQIQGLVSMADGDNTLDVVDLVVGYCRPMVRIGTYAWSHPRNGYRYCFRDNDNLESTDNKGVR